MEQRFSLPGFINLASVPEISTTVSVVQVQNWQIIFKPSLYFIQPTSKFRQNLKNICQVHQFLSTPIAATLSFSHLFPQLLP